MQRAHSFLRRLKVPVSVSLALVFLPPALAETLSGNNLSLRRIVTGLPVRASIASQPPAITSLSPVSATAGGAAFTLTIGGGNFTPTSTSKWGSALLKTTFVCETTLTAVVPASLIATAGTAGVTVTTAAGVSSAAAFTITLPLPAITSLNPATATAGHAFTVTINGRNFAPLATAKWGSAPLATTYVSGTQLTAAVPAGLVTAGSKAFVTVSTAVGTSPAAPLVVSQPAPVVSSLSPNSVVAGGPNLTVTINGANFLPGAGATVVRWNSTALGTTFVNCNQLTAVIPASLINNPGVAAISVVTTAGISSGLTFTTNPAPPVITAISPGLVPAGYGAFTIDVYGTNFSSTAIVNWGATPLVTIPQGGGTMVATVPASLVASIGTFNVTVTNAGGTSSPVAFRVVQPIPSVTSLSPSSVAAGGGNFTLTINGDNFTTAAQVGVGSTWLHVTYVSNTRLTVTVPSSLIASAGVIDVVAYISGIGFSPATLLRINPAPPAITSLNPITVTAGGAGFMLTINGTAFTPASTSMWGTTPLGTVYVSPTQLIAAVPASLIVESGTVSITVTTTAGTSAAASLPIKAAPPEISGLNPGVATAGGAAFAMTISGEYFTSATTAKWGSTALTTAYVSESQLTAAVPAGLIASAGTANITVTTSVGTSAPAGFTIYAAPKITTTTLPGATAGSAYSGAIQVTGGVPGYTWTVTGLPSTMSFSNTSGSTLIIAGTPAEPGTVNFQVSATDNSGATAGPVSYVVNVGSGPNGANNGSLGGSYVCRLQGFVDDDSTRWASLASFQADGEGHFSAGVFDTNSKDIGSASGTITGTYNIGSDLNGLASLRTILNVGAAGIQTTQWAIALTGFSQPAQEFRMVEADDLGERPSGEQGTADCFLATSSAFNANTVSGSSFAFGLEGEDGGGNLKVAAGVLSAAAGMTVSGSIDQAQGGSSTVQSLALTGTYNAPDPTTGRFKIALNPVGKFTGLTVYIIDANRMFILDNTSNNGEEAGSMHKQQQNSNSAANMTGPFVLYMLGAEFNGSGNTPSGYYAEVFEGAGDGNGNIAISQSYSNDNGVYSAGYSNGGPIVLDFDSTYPGRATFSSANGTTYLYLYNTSSAIEMSVGVNGSLSSGWMEEQVPQSQGAFTSAAMARSYLFGELPLFNGKSNGSVGEFTLTASGAINEAITTAGDGVLTWDQAASTTYNWDATIPGTGTFLVANGAQGGASCATINATRFVCTSQTDPSPSVQVVQQ